MLVYGDFELLARDDEAVYAIRRTLPDADYDLLILCDFTDERSTFDTHTGLDFNRTEVVLSNGSEPERDPRSADLQPYEAVVYRLHGT